MRTVQAEESQHTLSVRALHVHALIIGRKRFLNNAVGHDKATMHAHAICRE